MKTSMLRSDLFYHSDPYIVVKRDITLEGDNNANKRNRNLAFKTNAPFTNYISKINGVKIDNAEDLDVGCIIYLNAVKVTEKKLEVCGIVIGMNQVILFLLILNLLNTKQILQEKHQKIMIH